MAASESIYKVAIIGCGNMGRTYAKSFLQYGICAKDELVLVEKSDARRTLLAPENMGTVVSGCGSEVSESKIVVLAVKPQDFADLAADLKPHLQDDNIVLSIMAGAPPARVREALAHRNVVRAMPNLPARIGMGMTGFTAGPEVDRAHLRTAETLLNTTGRAIFLDNENLLDAVTAISGSGPAYFFFFIHQMVQAAREMGLDEATARVLVKQTMLGSYHLLNNTQASLEAMIASVSSKGGTTEAAFEVFQERGMGEALQAGIKRAEERAQELSNL